MMAPYYPPPDTNRLLHPLLACLPMAFVSTQPPPALLSILSPILRQRVKLLSETRTISDGSWLPLLNWNPTDGAQLPSVIENISFEAHPVSGELEFGDIEKARYKRADEETLQARTALTDLGLTVICTWCTNDAEGGEDGWRISELKLLQDSGKENSDVWYTTFSEADEKWRSVHNGASLTNGASNPVVPVEEEDDDSYWLQYDQTQSETPTQDLTPQPQAHASDPTRPEEEDQDYYSRYNSVQPEMDADDPSKKDQELGESTVHGNSLLGNREQRTSNRDETANTAHTRPWSSSSSVVAQSEISAVQQPQAEIAIQHHISSSIKNLYRLSTAAGMDRSEFRRIVSNELECLSLLDEE